MLVRGISPLLHAAGVCRLSHVALSADACLKRFADALGVSGRRAGSEFFCFSKFLSIAKWFDVVSFSATSNGHSQPLLSLSTPVDRAVIWQTLSASIFNDIAWLLFM